MKAAELKDNVIGILCGIVFGLVGAAIMQWWLNKRDANRDV